MNRVLAGLRRLAEPAGPREGRAPTVVTRAFTARRNRVLTGELGMAAVVDLPHAEDLRALVVTEDGWAELVSALLGVAESGEVTAAAGAFLVAAVSAASAAPQASSLALPSAGVASCLVVAAGGIRRLDPMPLNLLAAAEALAAQLATRLPGMVR